MPPFVNGVLQGSVQGTKPTLRSAPANGIWHNTHVANTATPRFGQANWPTAIPRMQTELAAAQGACDMVFLGDSITEFWLTLGASVWSSYYGHRRPLNQGISADRTQHLLYRINNMGFLDGISPKLAVLGIGHNNFYVADDDVPTIVDGIHACLDAVRKKLPNTKVLWVKLLPGLAANSPERAVRNAVNTVLDSSPYVDGVNVILHDLGDIFYEEGTEDIVTPGLIGEDMLHPVQAGYELYAASIESIVASIVDV